MNIWLMLSLYKIVTLEPKDTIGVQLSACSWLKRSGVILSKICAFIPGGLPVGSFWQRHPHPLSHC